MPCTPARWSRSFAHDAAAPCTPAGALWPATFTPCAPMPSSCPSIAATTTTATPSARQAGKEAAGAFPACRAGAAGLSKQHNRTLTPHAPATLRWFPGASLIDIELPAHHSTPRKRKQQPRGRIKEWSAASRSRLKHTLGRLQREELGRALVVTLTYPAEFPARTTTKFTRPICTGSTWPCAVAGRCAQASGSWSSRHAAPRIITSCSSA